jgi:hypothetical protein
VTHYEYHTHRGERRRVRTNDANAPIGEPNKVALIGEGPPLDHPPSKLPGFLSPREQLGPTSSKVPAIDRGGPFSPSIREGERA